MSFLSRFFKNKEVLLEALDLSVLGTDLHSHLIPGIDDGAQTDEEALFLIRELKSLGYSKLITTPHIMRDYYFNTSQIVLDGLTRLRTLLKDEGIEIEVEAAAEYYLDEHFEALIKADDLLTFGDKHILFELGFLSEPPKIKEVIFDLIMGGYKPILAHVERYPYYIGKEDHILDLCDRGVILQMNMSSLLGAYGPDVKRFAERLVDMDVIKVMGTDLHNERHLGYLKDVIHYPYLHKLASKPDLLNKHL